MKDCEYCLSSIREAAKICRHCGRIQNKHIAEIQRVSHMLEGIKKSVFGLDGENTDMNGQNSGTDRKKRM